MRPVPVAVLLGVLSTSLAFAAPDDVGQARLYLHVVLTGVHKLDWHWKAKVEPDGLETDDRYIDDTLTLILDGTTTWPVQADWNLGKATTFAEVSVQGGGRYYELRERRDECPKHPGAAKRDRTITHGRWGYTAPPLPATPEDFEQFSPLGQVVVSNIGGDEAHGGYCVTLSGACDFDAMQPHGNALERHDFCCIHERKPMVINADDGLSDNFDKELLSMLRDAYCDIVGGMLGQGKYRELLGKWELKKNGFFVSQRLADEGGVHKQPVTEGLPEGLPEGDPLTGTRDLYWTSVISYSASFTTKPQDIECTVNLKGPTEGATVGYEQWRPEGGPNESTGGNYIDIEARIHPKGRPNEAPKRKARFRFELVRSSQEPGVALNAPLKDPKRTPDLVFVNHGITTAESDGTVAQTQAGDLYAATARLECRDFGAYGAVRVYALLDDAVEDDQRTPVAGHLAGSPRETLTVPKDDNGNYIADSWDAGLASMDPRWDEETSPRPGAKPGDGLTQYEEYRGLVHGGRILRLDPRKKDLVVLNEAGEDGARGIHLFAATTGIEVRELLPGELSLVDDGSPDAVNLNSQTACGGSQFPVRLTTGTLPEKLLGQVVADSETQIRSPLWCKKLVITDDYSLLAGPARADRLGAEAAHLLAHALGVKDHGELSKQPQRKIVDTDPPIIHEYPTGLIALRPYPLAGDVETAADGGPASGDEECFMRAPYGITYVLRKDAAGVVHYYRAPPPGLPSRFCESPNGTGINARTEGNVSYFGNCAKGRGACLNRMRIKDW